jgi:pimeloyl-ACP methyl ester carboxylesterase
VIKFLLPYFFLVAQFCFAQDSIKTIFTTTEKDMQAIDTVKNTSDSLRKKTIYCFPGQGSDKRIFDSLSLGENYSIKIIEYGAPEKNMSMQSFAKQLSAQIDTTEDFILLGVSLGGMICCELTEFLKPEKTILISSAKNRKELPFRYSFQRIIPVYKLFPGKILLAGAKILQPLVEPDRNKNKETFVSMLNSKNPTYLKRTIELIIKWDRKENKKKIFHIHGTKDHTLPLRKIKSPDHIVKKGSHMMTLTKPEEINKILRGILSQ